MFNLFNPTALAEKIKHDFEEAQRVERENEAARQAQIPQHLNTANHTILAEVDYSTGAIAPAPGSGRKKALMIGVQYSNHPKLALKSCPFHNVRTIKETITSLFGYHDNPQDMVVLTDDNTNPHFVPTRDNMLNAMKWLVGNARAGDNLFFYFCGHGGQVPDKDGDESNGLDSFVCPSDIGDRGENMIIDDEMNAIMVQMLPVGVKLTCFADTCHSGSGLDLPYVYNKDGSLQKFNAALESAKFSGATANNLIHLRLGGALISMYSSVVTAKSGKKARQKAQETRSSKADVIMISGCDDSECAYEFGERGAAERSGALTTAIAKVFREHRQLSYLDFLKQIRIETKRWGQHPQLSSGRPMDMQNYVSL